MTLGGFASAQAIPGYRQVVENYRASDVLVQDRHGILLDRIRTDFHGRRGDWLALDDVSPALQRAVILSEDRRFYEHGGIDWQAVAAAAWGNAVHGQHRGASTISMQLMGLINQDLRRLSSGRSLMQKIDQARQAQELESVWTKSQILEAYLNLAAFRGELVGVDALSRVLFQKHASGLDAREAAVAAVLLRGPNAAQTTVVQRACGLLIELGRPQECKGLSDFTARVLRRKSAAWAEHRSLAPHYAQVVFNQLSTASVHGQTVSRPLRTSLDASLQAFVVQSMDKHVRALRHSNVRDAAVVVLDNATGQVLAYVGSTGDLSLAANVDHVRALRQAGSTLKPFLYAQALGQQRLTTVSLLDDSPLNLAAGTGVYIPQNYDKKFSGWASVRVALASSLNIPAVRVLMMVGPGPFAQLLRKLGLPLDQSGDFYGYSLALGSADVSLLSLTNAYRALANSGDYSPVRWLDPLAFAASPGGTVSPVAGAQAIDTASHSVVPAGAAWIVGDILADRQARTATFGLDSPLSTPFWSAVKTGTSKDMRDNWCMGWSQRYTVGVWVGNSGGDSMHDVSGVSGAGPLWHDIMSWLHRNQSSVQPAMPATVQRTQVVFQDTIEPSRQDVFLGDTAISTVSLASSAITKGSSRSGIVEPVDGSIFALDPDIPRHNQRVSLRAVSLAGQGSQKVSWRIGKDIIAQGPLAQWAPWPGRHKVQLLDEAGTLLQQINIEVRGAQTK
ncbi:MAG: penicillin-binding protein 1C [Burkholderiaceae bacterium]|nr:penicillin-binding protein 1C [Burkholderiaceae bacterium]